MSSRGDTVSKPGYAHREAACSRRDLPFASSPCGCFADTVAMVDKEKGCWEFSLLLV